MFDTEKTLSMRELFFQGQQKLRIHPIILLQYHLITPSPDHIITQSPNHEVKFYLHL